MFRHKFPYQRDTFFLSVLDRLVLCCTATRIKLFLCVGEVFGTGNSEILEKGRRVEGHYGSTASFALDPSLIITQNSSDKRTQRTLKNSRKT